jgi:hypothetical protein
MDAAMLTAAKQLEIVLGNRVAAPGHRRFALGARVGQSARVSLGVATGSRHRDSRLASMLRLCPRVQLPIHRHPSRPFDDDRPGPVAAIAGGPGRRRALAWASAGGALWLRARQLPGGLV